MAKKTRYSTIPVKQLDVAALFPQLENGCVIAIDVAKEKMVFGVATKAGETLQLVAFAHPTETHQFLAMVAKLATALGHERVVVVLEPTGTYGDVLVYQCRKLGVAVHMMSPKRTHDSAEVFDGVPSLHDAKSAWLLAKLYAQGLSSEYPVPSPERRELRAQVERRALEDARHEHCVSQLEALLARHWPEFACWLSVRQQRSALHLLATFGSPEAVAANAPGARELLLKISHARLSAPLIEGIISGAMTSMGLPMTLQERLRVQTLARYALDAKDSIDSLNEQFIKVCALDVALGFLRVLLGAYTTCALMALCDPRQMSKAYAFEKALGLNLKVHSSGEHKGRLMITKRGPSLARKLLYLATLRLLKNPIVNAWYTARSGHTDESRMRAVVAVMRKLARAVYHVARGQPFDAAKLFDVRRLKLPEATQEESKPCCKPRTESRSTVWRSKQRNKTKPTHGATVMP